MNTDQVIEGIGKAVAAAKPAQEYCFLWIDWWPMCMTKAEWSGWMQAFGAVAAILAVWWQSMRAQKNLELEREARIKGILDRAIAAVQELSRFCDRSSLLIAALANGHLISTAVDQLHATLDATATQFERLPFWDLPESKLAIELQDVSQAVRLLHIAMDHAQGDAYGLMENLKLACDQAEATLTKRLHDL